MSVADFWDNSRGEGAWNPSFVRLLNDWEVEDVQHFFSMLNSRRVKQEEKDIILEGG